MIRDTLDDLEDALIRDDHGIEEGWPHFTVWDYVLALVAALLLTLFAWLAAVWYLVTFA